MSEAAEWFIRFHNDGMSRHDRMRYLCWLKQSPEHVVETLRFMRIYRLLRSILVPLSTANKEIVPPSGLVDCKHSGSTSPAQN